MKSLNYVRRITDPLYRSDLDCIGLSCLIHYALMDAHISHTIKQGAKNAIYNRRSHYESHCHMWIELKTTEGKAVIDYRLKTILGPEGNTPHGVFLKSDNPHIVYMGSAVPAIYPRNVMEWVANPDPFNTPKNLEEAETHIDRMIDQWGWTRIQKQLPRNTTPQWLPEGHQQDTADWRIVVRPER